MTSKEIVDYVLEENDWSRKTVHTLISRLANKGVMNVANKNKYYEYSPCISKSDCQIEETKTFLEKVYNGSLQMFLTNFVKNQHLSKEEIAELKSIIILKNKSNIRRSNMQRILILIFIFLLGLNMKQPTNNLESEIIINKKSYKYGFENNTIFLSDEKEDKHYSDNINIPDDKTILCMTTGDLDDDDTDEILLLSSAKGKKYGNDLIIYSMVIENETIKYDEIYKNDFTNVKPWEIKLCDLDGDNNKDIYVGVYKSTPMFDKVENRPFFFNWNGKILTKKWTGSKLEHPLESVHFYDIIGDSKEEMIVVEKLENTKEVISIYYWFNFGFIKFAESNSYYNIEDISLTTQDDIKYISLNLGRKKHIKLHLEGNKFIENISLD